MIRGSRIFVQIAITASVATLLSVGVPTFVDRREYAVAISKALNNPSPANEAQLRQEAAKTDSAAFWTRLVAAGVLFILMNGCWLVASRVSPRLRHRIRQ